MALYITHLVNVKITRDSAGKDVRWGPDKTLATEVFTNMQRYVSGEFSIAASGTEALSLGDIGTVLGAYIEFDAAANVTWNGGTAQSYAPADSTAGRQARAFNEMTITSISVANPSASVALTGRYVLWGAAA